MTREQRIAGFAEAIWAWYAVHKRTLPWRDMPIADADERAYRVLVSEVMLQQTQVSRVKIVFKDFLSKFGSLEILARASNAEILLAWRGMGYNSRALRLRDAARSVVREHAGHFPREMEDLLSIDGIGPYTAAAIRNFAFNIPTPCIDTNIRRILHRTFIGPENVDGVFETSDKYMLKLAERVLDVAIDGTSSHTAAEWHAALMDYGSLVQTKNNPKWGECELTARGLMKTTPNNWTPPVRGAAKERLKKEPGRMVGSTYIPNRIFRGKVVEALRDAKKPMSVEELGRIACIDWEDAHKPWLKGLVDKLVKDALITRSGEGYVLSS